MCIFFKLTTILAHENSGKESEYYKITLKRIKINRTEGFYQKNDYLCSLIS